MLRIDEIKAATAINVEAERKVAQLSDEIQALARSVRIKDQTIQETGVKIELMERRMETVKKQADAITDLENELAKARKQERAYEEAMEQLQADLDGLEQDNAKLKTLATNPERQATAAQVVEVESVPTEGNLETSYLLEQVRRSCVCVRLTGVPLSVVVVSAGRRAARNGSVLAHGEFVSQGPGPAQGDRSAARAARTAPSRGDPATGAVDAVRFGLGLGRRAALSADAALPRGRVEAAVPGGDQVHLVPARRRPLCAQGEPRERAADDEGVDAAEEDAGVSAVRAEDGGRAAGQAAQGIIGADEPHGGCGLRLGGVRRLGVHAYVYGFFLCPCLYPRNALLLYPHAYIIRYFNYPQHEDFPFPAVPEACRMSYVLATARSGGLIDSTTGSTSHAIKSR